jgi:hypothetical protein
MLAAEMWAKIRKKANYKEENALLSLHTDHIKNISHETCISLSYPLYQS